MPTGKVEFFSALMGFGFVAPDEGGPHVIVQVPALAAANLPDLSVGDEIRYELQDAHRLGKQVAVDVEIVKSALASPRTTC